MGQWRAIFQQHKAMHGDPVLASISYQTGSCVFMVFCSLHSFISQSHPPPARIKPFCGSLNPQMPFTGGSRFPSMPRPSKDLRSVKLDLGSLLYSNPREPHTFNPPGLLCLRAAGCPPTQSLPTPTSPGGNTFLHPLLNFLLRTFFSPPSGEKSSHSPLPQAPFSSEYSCGCLV